MSNLKTATKCAEDGSFFELAESVRETFHNRRDVRLFSVDTDGLWDAWLQHLPAAERAHHDCHACRRFVEKWGGAVVVGIGGHLTSVLWHEKMVSASYEKPIKAMRKHVENQPVTSVLLSGQKTWGEFSTTDVKRLKTWYHFHVENPSVYSHPLQTAFQAASLKREEVGVLRRSLDDYSQDVVKRAVALLETEQFYRGEKVLGVARWFLELHENLSHVKHQQHRDNMLWRAVAAAPPGFAGVRSSMIGTLLDDLVAGLAFEEVRQRFADKMHPLQYRRTQAPPGDGNIAEAEKVIAVLRSAGSLERRFARLEDVLFAFWRRPEKEVAASSGVFGHLKTIKPVAASSTGTVITITWSKFNQTVLAANPDSVEFQVPPHGSFVALVTAQNPDAPPILQWDSESRRNPLSWYMYAHGSSCELWHLTARSWAKVTMVTVSPNACFVNNEGLIFFILEGARDTIHQQSGGFFTESLKSEYHAVRRTLEAYMMRAPIAGRDEATACGYALQKGGAWGAFVRVTSNGLQQTYKLDRWD